MQAITFELIRDKECKGSVRFATNDDQALVTNIYVSRATPGINSAKRVKLTLEIADANTKMEEYK